MLMERVKKYLVFSVKIITFICVRGAMWKSFLIIFDERNDPSHLKQCFLCGKSMWE